MEHSETKLNQKHLALLMERIVCYITILFWFVLFGHMGGLRNALKISNSLKPRI